MPANIRNIRRSTRPLPLWVVASNALTAWRARLAKVLLATVMLSLFGTGIFYGRRWAVESPYFGLHQIQWAGNVRSTPSELRYVSGLMFGQNILAMDAGAVEKLLLSHPWVKSAVVRRGYPDRLLITLVEQRPAAFVSLGDLYLVNDEGDPFKRAQPGESLDLPIVTGWTREQFLSHQSDNARAVREALSLLQLYAQNQAPLGKISEVRRDVTGWTFVSTDGASLYFGDGDYTEKLKRLVKVKTELDKRNLVAQVVRLDNRTKPQWITMKTSPKQLEREVAAQK